MADKNFLIENMQNAFENLMEASHLAIEATKKFYTAKDEYSKVDKIEIPETSKCTQCGKLFEGKGHRVGFSYCLCDECYEDFNTWRLSNKGETK